MGKLESKGVRLISSFRGAPAERRKVGGRSDEGKSPSMNRSRRIGYDMVGRELWCRFLEILDFEKYVPRHRRDPSWDVPETWN